jgi:hypothetical protein
MMLSGESFCFVQLDLEMLIIFVLVRMYVHIDRPEIQPGQGKVANQSGGDHSQTKFGQL